jgi:hypothetical protein
MIERAVLASGRHGGVDALSEVPRIPTHPTEMGQSIRLLQCDTK